jgi:fluoroacetyl-CoA thioesterase
MFNIYDARQLTRLMKEPEIDATVTAELFVSQSDLASALTLEPGDSYPDVFSTSRMVALIEIASSRILRPYLRPGELSVGVTVDVTHTAATPRGVKVIATERYLGREGKLFLFEVTAEDRGGEIGRGTHKRAVTSTERLLAGADKRNRSM